jgi:GR25 family glycosyltransferase involved in LPS biosynthesis
VELVKPLEELYQLLQHLPADMDMCHLAKSDWYPFALTNQVNAYFAECAKLFFNKTTAYIVSKKGAQKILAYTPSSINVPIDDLYNMIYRLTDFRFYVPLTYFFKEQDNISSSIKDIDHA